MRRAYAPVLASFRPRDDGDVELWVTNDRPAALRDSARVRLGRFDGEPLHEEAVDVRIAPHRSACVASWPAEALPGGPDRYLSVASQTGAFPANRRFFTAIKDLRRPRAAVEHTIEPSPGGVTVRLNADAYAYFVCVAVGDERVRFSDNYIELEPGEARTLNLTAPDGVELRPEDLAVRWR